MPAARCRWAASRRRSSTSSRHGVQQRRERRAEAEARESRSARASSTLSERVHQHRSHADDHRRAAVAQRVERRREHLHRRVADQARRVAHQARARRRRCRSEGSAHARRSRRTIGTPSAISPNVAGTVERQHEAHRVRQRLRAAPAMSPRAACCDISGSDALAIATPNRPIGRYMMRNAKLSHDTAPGCWLVASTVFT